MDRNAQIKSLRASAKQLAQLPCGRSNSFTEEARMEDILILLTEADRLEKIELSHKKSVSL